MLSAIAPRKDSAQSSKERLKHQYAPHTTSPLANSSTTTDIVTNDDRAKSADIMRVLSPMRPRRTPKLVNAPELKWRLPSHLRHMPSLDSMLSSNTSASEASTVHAVPVAPHNIALPASSTSSIITVLADIVPQDVPLPLSPSPPSSPSPEAEPRASSPTQQSDAGFDETRVSDIPRIISQLGAHQPHALSPVTEATSALSLRSSILDLNVQDVGTAERRPLSDIGQQNVHVVEATENDVACRQSRPRRKATSGRIFGDGEDRYSESIASVKREGCFISGRDEDEKIGVRRVVCKLRKGAKRAARRAAECLARRYVTRVLARVL